MPPDVPATRPPDPDAPTPARRLRRRPAASGLVRYLAGLSGGRYVLWCYFLYWAVIAGRYFDPRPGVWLTSAGLAGIIGVALLLNATRSGPTPTRLGRWPTFRLFVTPFCVSSFAALVKDRGFVLVFPPRASDAALAVGAFVALGLAVRACRGARKTD